MKKLILILSLFVIMTVSSCETSKININKNNNPEPPPFPPIGDIKTFDIEAKKWQFTPNIIPVNLGDTVILNIKSIDVNHGFLLSGYNIDKKLNPGETVQVEFIADQKGTFNFACTVPCGEGHADMKGKLIVN